jgi:hypothetical protein
VTRHAAEADELAARLLDLPADDLLNVVDRAAQIREHRALDPTLRPDVLRAVDRAVVAGRLDETEAAAIRSELDEARASVVLEANASTLIEDRPTPGAFPRAREDTEPPDLDAWLRSDPRRLGGIVAEAARFSLDLKAVAAEVLALADRLGIDEAVADDVVVAALRAVASRDGGRRAG